MKCELLIRCVAYTFEQSRLNCLLHSSTDQGQKSIQGKQTGRKKAEYILSLPEISFCYDKNRQRRCRLEPKCHHVNCFRNAQDSLPRPFFTVKDMQWSRVKVLRDMMPVLLRMSMTAIRKNASVHILTNFSSVNHVHNRTSPFKT